MSRPLRVLFLLKRREFAPTFNCETYAYSRSSGLLNSVRFVVDMLNDQGHDAILEECVDNNCIDRLVTQHRPTHVVLEALWVVPEKLEILKRLHPTVTWIVRLHSEVPFIANEGIACEWLYGYRDRGVLINANSERMCRAERIALGVPVSYSPNYYPVECEPRWQHRQRDQIDIGCFGAVRPLKNHLIQAKAAIAYADRHSKKLRFHINASRAEGNGGPVLKNLRALFAGSYHDLIEHEWLPHDQFRRLCAEMDLILQVSFTETFNIVVADAVAEGVPVVTSKEIRFIACPFTASPVDIDGIIRAMGRAMFAARYGLHEINYALLRRNAVRAVRAWGRLLADLAR
jgi:glycosyltransferase involved in cell wall biosynthesis